MRFFIAMIFVFLIFWIPIKATDSPSFVDLFVILKQINHTNEIIKTYEKNPKKINESEIYTEQKMDLIKEFVSKIIDKKQKIQASPTQNKIERSRIQLSLAQNPHNEYLKFLNILLLDSLEADDKMYELVENLRQNINIFSQKENIIKIIEPYLKKFNELLNNPYSMPKNIKEDQKKILENELNQFQVKIKGYTEVLIYLQIHINDILPKNDVGGLNIGWLLTQINHYIPLDGSNIEIAKIVLSLLTLIVLLGCRKILAVLILKIVDFFVKFTRHIEIVQSKIRDDIIMPISWFLLFWSFDISSDILYYPNSAFSKIQEWFGVVYISLLAWLIISLLKGYGGAFLTTITQKSSDGFRKEVINLILKTIYFIVIIFAFLAILKHLGFNISTIVASLGIGGLAVALAVKDVLANFFASVMLLFDNSFSQGDWIVCGEVEGTVVEMGLRRTTIRTFDNALLFVPNSELANKTISNWNRRKVGRRIKMSVGLTYNSSREQLARCVKEIKEMLLANPNISKDNGEWHFQNDHQAAFKKNIVSMDDYLGYKNTLFVFVDEFADSSINLLIYCFSKSVVWGEFLQVKEDIIYEIIKIVEANGLSFAFPSQSIYVESFPKDLISKK